MMHNIKGTKFICAILWAYQNCHPIKSRASVNGSEIFPQDICAAVVDALIKIVAINILYFFKNFHYFTEIAIYKYVDFMVC